jgi:hypothetical protein
MSLEVLGQANPAEAVVAGLGFDKRFVLGLFIQGVGSFFLAAIRAQHVGIKPGAAQGLGFVATPVAELFVITHRR